MQLRVAAACLICYWLQTDEHILFWLLDSLTDIILCLSPQGSGAEYLLTKFRSLFALAKQGEIHTCLSSSIATCVSDSIASIFLKLPR